MGLRQSLMFGVVHVLRPALDDPMSVTQSIIT